jgi:hypothetical protein
MATITKNVQTYIKTQSEEGIVSPVTSACQPVRED